MFEIILSILTFISLSFLGLLVFSRNRKSWTNRLFLLLVIFVDLYVFTNYISLNPPNGTAVGQLFWIRVVMSGGSFVGPILFLLVHTFPKDKIHLSKYGIASLLILALSSAFLALSPLMFTSVQYQNGKALPVPGPAIAVFFIDFPLMLLLSFGLLILRYRKSLGVEKLQYLYFLLGVIGTFSLMAILSVIFVVIFKVSDMVFWGPISSLILAMFLAYAILKHRMFDIKLVTVRAVVYILLALTLGVLYVSGLFLASTFVFESQLSLEILAVYTSLAVLVAFSLHPIRNFFDEVTDKYLYKGNYKTDEILHVFSQIMALNLSLESVTGKVLETLKEKMHVSRTRFVVFNEGEIVFSKKGSERDDFELSEEELKKLCGTKKLAVFLEVEEGERREIMGKYNIAIFAPLFVREKLIGALILGEKASGDIYFEKDLSILEILAHQLAISLENSLQYEQIKQFNERLQDEVNKATSDLKKANEHLKELDRLKDEFVSVASHELRAPMTVVQGYVWKVLQDKSLTLDDRKSLDHAYASTRRLINLVNDMLDVSKIESGRMEFVPTKFDLAKMAADVKEEFVPKLSEKSITLDVEGGKEYAVIADNNKIEQVLINIVDNAVKFTQPKGKVKISFRQKNGNIETSVTDNGPGIREEDFPKLFTKFGRLDSALSPTYQTKGTGLGLYLCKKIIEKSGGKIWAEKGLKKGSTFTFSLKEG